jgi:hypothetical protein
MLDQDVAMEVVGNGWILKQFDGRAGIIFLTKEFLASATERIKLPFTKMGTAVGGINLGVTHGVSNFDLLLDT